MRTRVAIRVDASSQIGTGHFMRCLTLADGLLRGGAHIAFLCRALPAHLADMVLARGHRLLPLDVACDAAGQGDLAHSHWLDSSQEADARTSLAALGGQQWDWLVVDHYALDRRWERALRPCAGNILVIDDLADRAHDCDALLDQNFYENMSSRYEGKVPAGCDLLLGPRYALLREEFGQARALARPRQGPVQRILVCFGGMDAQNLTGQALDAILALGAGAPAVDVVVGVQHPRREHIAALCAQHQFGYHVQTNQMARLMAAADLALGAGGSTIWERCCLGLPTLAVCAAQNQARQLADAASRGWLSAPDIEGDLAEGLALHLRALLGNGALRSAISRCAMPVVDGAGVARVGAMFGAAGLAMRPATRDDSAQLFAWRNHPSIRAVSRSADELRWTEHCRWFDAVLASADRCLLIGQRDGAALGVVRFDCRGDMAEVSIYVVPGVSERGLGKSLLRGAERWLGAHRPDIRAIQACVLADNERSQRLFSGAGYQTDSICYSKKW